MKKNINRRTAALIMMVFILFALPMTAFAAEEYWIKEMSAQGEIISDVNVREGPGTDSEKIGTVKEKEIVTITGQSFDGWYQIEFEGGTGYIYGQYVSVVSTMPEDIEDEEDAAEVEEETDTGEAAQVTPEPEADGEPEEAEEAPLSSSFFKMAAIVLIIVFIIIMIFLTIRSMRQDEDTAEEEDGEDEEDEEDEYGGDGNEEEDGEEEERVMVKTGKIDPQTIIIREEDYQLHIDPKYFEDEPIAQPDYVTDYLKKQEKESADEESRKGKTGDLQQAMNKLQEELEELKKAVSKKEN